MTRNFDTYYFHCYDDDWSESHCGSCHLDEEDGYEMCEKREYDYINNREFILTYCCMGSEIAEQWLQDKINSMEFK